MCTLVVSPYATPGHLEHGPLPEPEFDSFILLGEGGKVVWTSRRLTPDPKDPEVLFGIAPEDRERAALAIVTALSQGSAGPILLRLSKLLGGRLYQVRFLRAAKLLMVEFREVFDTPLTEVEMTVLRMVCDGKTNNQISRTLGVSRRTVDEHRRKLFVKTGASGTAMQVRWAIRQGLIKA